MMVYFYFITPTYFMRFKSQAKIIDEFAFVLLGALIFIGVMLIFWTTPEELPPSLEPRSISIKMLPSSEKTITFKVIGNLSSVKLEANGTLLNIVYFPENNFNVYGEKEVKAILKSPTSLGKYSGHIVAIGKGGEDAIELTVNVVPTLTLTSRSVSVEDFTISNYGSEKVVANKTKFSLEKSLFSSKSAKLAFELEKGREVEELKLKLAVEDVSGPGYLVIRFNGNVVYKRKLDGPIFEEVPLNTSDLKEINFILFEVENEGFGILSKTVYSIYDAKVVVRYKSLPYTYALNLSHSEIDNFYALEFSSIPIQQNYPSVEIKVNNQKVFIGKLPVSVFRLNVSRDLIGNNLLLFPTNNISFSLITEGEIHFSNNIVRIYSYSS